MSSVLQFLHPSLWGDMLHSSVGDLGHAAFWAAVLQIVFINMLLSGDNAIAKYREVMGATDPAKAADGTIRKVHAKSIGENSVHGSDAADTAAQEIAQFFAGNEIVG